MTSDTKVRKRKRGKPLSDSTGNVSVTAIHALREIYKDKTLSLAISSLLRWSDRITSGRGSRISYICSADGVTVQGRGWQLNIDDISSLITEKREYESLRRIIEELTQSRTGKA